jgi:hypothetical protein
MWRHGSTRLLSPARLISIPSWSSADPSKLLFLARIAQQKTPGDTFSASFVPRHIFAAQAYGVDQVGQRLAASVLLNNRHERTLLGIIR